MSHDKPTGAGICLRLDDLGGLLLDVGDSEAVRVRAVPAFPWLEQTGYLVLVDTEGRERALIEDPGSLDPASREALRAARLDGTFLFSIRKILAIEENFQLRRWEVQTDQGWRRFQTRLEDWPSRLPDGTLLIRDVAGDQYRVCPQGLEPASRRILAPLVDDCAS